MSPTARSPSPTPARISALSFSQLTALSSAGFTNIVDTSGAITWNVAQFQHLTTGLTLNGMDLILSDSEAVLEAQSPATWSYIASLATVVTAANTNTLNLSFAQISGLYATDCVFADDNTVTLTDTGAHIAAMSKAQIGYLAGIGVDSINASNDVLTLNAGQYGALGTVTLTAADDVTISDTGAKLATLDFSTLGANGVDVLDATNNVLTLTATQYSALGAVMLTADDQVTVADTAANIAELDFSTLAAANVDMLDVSGAFSLTVARYESMGSTIFASGDSITLADTGLNISALTAGQMGALAAHGIDAIDASDNSLSLSVAQFQALQSTAVALAQSNTVTLADAGSTIAGLSAMQIGQLAAAGIDAIDASDNSLTLSLAQYEALGSVTLTGADLVTVRNDNVALGAMSTTEIQALSANQVDVLESTNGNFTFSVAQAHALVNQTGGGHVALSAAIHSTSAIPAPMNWRCPPPTSRRSARLVPAPWI